ncbi:MAG: hypothetical protein A2017_06900 [Lentisphaerae bacterium GWF2_44_16]|nr:MAG: hypothetical protein A2017_06900 [Lentisphaerae bacterium GWF2_44_16]
MRALSFGELLWDIIGNKEYLGGAPFNLTAHLAGMGTEVSIISALGRDDLGKDALFDAEDLNVDTEFIQVHDRYPTGTVDVKVDNKGIPSYAINENTAWDNIDVNDNAILRIKEKSWNVFCFGTLAQRTETNRKSLWKIIENISFDHIFYDVNLRQNYFEKEHIEKSLKASSIVKLNSEEAVFLSQYIFNGTMTEKEFAARLSVEYGIEIVCITRGENGSAVFYENEFREIPGIPVKTADTVGAGDSYGAAFLFAFLSGKSPSEAAAFAGKIASYVASQNGAIPEYSEEIIKTIENIKI